MNTNSLKRFATVARNLLIQGVRNRLKAVGFNDDGSIRVEPVATGNSAIFDGQVINDSRFVGRWNALRKRIEQLGDGEKGVKAVIEEAAYTWFNRLMAIRILEYNSLAPALLDYENPLIRIPRIVTDARAGKTPILSDEERASLDAVIGNGRLSFEQFSILIRTYCENNPIIRKCFGGITDYTVLLLPADILAEDGFIDLLNKADEFISHDDYRKPELIGWLYQFYISEKKDEVFAKKGGYDSDEIPAATQIFTPNWIVKYMVENTLGSIYLDNNPDSGIAENWKYLVEPADGRTHKSASLQYDSLEDLKCGDLSCGSGHILNEMFDLLMQLYAEDFYSPREAIEAILTKNMVGIDLDDRARQLAQFALLLKACQTDTAFADGHCMPRIYSMPEVDRYTWRDLGGHFNHAYEMHGPGEMGSKEIEDAFILMENADVLGSIMKFKIGDEARGYMQKAISEFETAPKFEENFMPLIAAFRVILALTDKYAALCMNPPYMPTNKEAILKSYATKEYPDSKADLFAIFMDVAIDRLREHGKYGMINMQSWMFLGSYESLRKNVIENQQIDSLLHLGPRTFDELSGEVVQNAAFVISKEKPSYPGVYYRLIDGSNCNAKRDMFLAEGNRYVVTDQKQFEQIPGAPIAYWVSERVREAFAYSKIGDENKVIAGLCTGDNANYIFFWSEMSKRDIMFPTEIEFNKKFKFHNKGGSARKWYGNQDYIVKYNEYSLKILTTLAGFRNDGNEYFYRPSISWAKISAKSNTFRYYPAGFIFDSAGSSIFGNEMCYNYIMGLCNSIIGKYIVNIINPTLNASPGIIKQIPLIKRNQNLISDVVSDCISISKQDWDAHETSWDFETSPLLAVDNQTYCDNIDWMIECHRRKTGEQICIDPAAPEFGSLKWRYDQYCQKWECLFDRLHHNEEELNRKFIDIYGLQDELTRDVALEDVTILQQGEIRWEEGRPRPDNSSFLSKDAPIAVHGELLPHWNQEGEDGKYLFLTFRLADSLPKEKQQELKSRIDQWMALHPKPWDQPTENEYRKLFSHKIETWLDNGYGCCILRNPEAAGIVEETIRHDDGNKYELADYVIMPNHVHVLVRLYEGIKVETLMQEWKSVSSHKLRKVWGHEWCGWMEKYHDRHIRNEEHFNNVIAYIGKNHCSDGVIRMVRMSKTARGRASSQLKWQRDVIIKQFISYAVGCMMGRYRLDRPGLAIAHPNPEAEEYAPYIVPQTGEQWWIDDDGIVPMMGEDSPFHDNAANRFTEFVRVALGNEYLTENMNFVRDALGKDVVEYFRSDFYKEHKKMYQNRPIYWMFSSNQKGKRAAFQCLVYMHRMNRFTPEHIRTNYLLPYIDHLAAREAELSGRSSLSAKENKQLKQLRSDLEECRDYQLRLHEFADRQIEIDLDDGVVKNYATFAPVLAKLK